MIFIQSKAFSFPCKINLNLLIYRILSYTPSSRPSSSADSISSVEFLDKVFPFCPYYLNHDNYQSLTSLFSQFQISIEPFPPNIFYRF